METYAVRVTEKHAATYLIKANSLDDAIAKAEEFNNKVGFDLEEISEMTFEESPCSNADGTATKEQLEYCEWLEEE